MFIDRRDAGEQLAEQLARYRGEDAVVLALPRGGVPVAVEVARALGVPLDIVVVRKLGAPSQPELGMGAVAEGGVRVVDGRMVRRVGATRAELAAVIAREESEVTRRVARWRGNTRALPLAGKTAIIVDDGIATGGTMRAALACVRAQEPRRVVVAVPVAAVSTLDALEREGASEIVCVEPVETLWAIGEWYEDFRQVRDEDVTAMLASARSQQATTPAGAPTSR